jgi:hypothetical protein
LAESAVENIANIGKLMIRWSGDIEFYYNILPIFPQHSLPKGKGSGLF